jgi:RNA polymerase sigma factor (sigma-70 family)
LNVPATETPTDGKGWSLGSNSEPAGASIGRGPITTNGAILPAATLQLSAPPRFARASDEQLARAAGRGDAAAFEALYERHHLPLLSFARHMVGGVHDAEDVVQHTFLAADRDLRAGKVPKAVRAWLYTVARNRCVSLLRARREAPGLPDAGTPSTENLAADVEQREDLRDLLADLRTLPDAQRAALLLAELGDLSHAEVAKVIGVRAGKVKALVFQARETLMASAAARAIPCRSIQEELAVATGADLRRRHLRSHLAQCAGCSEYAESVRAQRRALALVLPVGPTLALRDAVLSGLAGSAGGAGATAAGIGGLLAAKSTAAKMLTIAAVGGAAAGGGTVAVTANDAGSRDRTAERREPRAPAVPAARPTLPVAAPATGGGAAQPVRSRPTPDRRGRSEPPANARRTRPKKRTGPPPAAADPHGNARANGPKQRPAAEFTPPGQAKPTPRRGPPAHARSNQAGPKAKPLKAAKQPKPAPARAVKPSPKPAKPAPARAVKPSPKPAKPRRAAEPTAAADPAKPEPPGQANKSAEVQPVAEPVPAG